MRKGHYSTIPILLIVTAVLGAAPTASRAEAEKGKAKYVVKIATLAPDGTVWMNSLRKIADYVEKASNGELHIKFYAGGVMGDEPDVVRKMKLGQLDGSGVSLTGVRLTCPEFQVLELPFLFGPSAYDEAEYVLRNLYTEFDRYAEKNGYRIIGLGSAGFAHICSEKPLPRMLKDLPQQKVWQWEGETVMKAISESMGVPTISLPLPDTLTALQTGMINAFYGTAIHVLAFQWNRYVNYLYRPSIFYTPSFVVITERCWNRIPQHIRDLFFDETAMKIKMEALHQVHVDDEKSLQILRQAGTKIVDIPPDQLEEMKVRTKKVYAELSGKIFPEELLLKVQGLLSEYRAQSRGKRAP